MPPGERILPAAAVIGVSFGADLLAEVAGVDRADALDGLAAHAHAGLVVFDAVGGRYSDAAAHQQVYAGIAPSERARLHRRVAEALVAWKTTLVGFEVGLVDRAQLDLPLWQRERIVDREPSPP